MGWASSGFEIGNVLARGTFPAARLKRPGPDPAPLASGASPFDPRATPIRARNIAFAIGEVSGRALLALGPFVGPGLVKCLTVTHSNLGFVAELPHFNMFYATSPYVTANNITLAVIPAGTPLLEGRTAIDTANVMIAEGGLVNSGQSINGHRFLFDAYIADPTFYLALVVRNNNAAAGNFGGDLLVYEGVIPADFPMILG